MHFNFETVSRVQNVRNVSCSKVLVSQKMALKLWFQKNTLYKIFRKDNSRVKGRNVDAILSINQTYCVVVQNHVNAYILQLNTFKVLKNMVIRKIR